MRVLLVEDDSMIAQATMTALKDAAYAVDCVMDGMIALDSLASNKYDIMVLDIGLPELDGFDVLKSVRQSNQSLAILLITARDSLEDRIKGLDLGADDYLVKPFNVSELMARIRAVVRRHHGNSTPVLTNGFLYLYPQTHELVVNEKTYVLSAREFSLLRALLIRPGIILNRKELEEKIYGWNEEIESNAIDFLIHSLRKKIGSDAIKNIRGAGWMVEKFINGKK